MKTDYNKILRLVSGYLALCFILLILTELRVIHTLHSFTNPEDISQLYITFVFMVFFNLIFFILSFRK